MSVTHNFAGKKVLIAAPEVQRISVRECGERLTDMRQLGWVEVIQTAETPAKQPYYALIRQTVAEKLAQARRLLPEGLRLRLLEGYRSPEVQQREFDAQLARIRERAPELSLEQAFTEAIRLISPVNNLDGSINIPPHGTGAAVDVDIIDAQGAALDFGMEIKDLWTVNPMLCETQCLEIPAKARENRELLFRIMTETGFVNYFTEWWHFSFGDKYWAFQTGSEYAIYGLIEKAAIEQLPGE